VCCVSARRSVMDGVCTIVWMRVRACNPCAYMMCRSTVVLILRAGELYLTFQHTSLPTLSNSPMCVFLASLFFRAFCASSPTNRWLAQKQWQTWRAFWRWSRRA
jgi:hypothetical protein